MNDKQWINDFVSQLWRLSSPENPGSAKRPILARLRRGLGKPLAVTLIRGGGLYNGVPEYALEAAVLVSGLFAEHQQPHGRGSIGLAFRKLRQESSSESIEKRFAHLADSNSEDLPDRLRHVVKLLAAKDIPVDWARLLRDILTWDVAERPIQRQWALDFWRESAQYGSS
jgi:CRISPR system Cascade subunit CasB